MKPKLGNMIQNINTWVCFCFVFLIPISGHVITDNFVIWPLLAISTKIMLGMCLGGLNVSKSSVEYEKSTQLMITWHVTWQIFKKVKIHEKIVFFLFHSGIYLFFRACLSKRSISDSLCLSLSRKKFKNA